MYRGHIDHPLSKKGWREMRNAVAGRDDWQVVFHSPLCRCADFSGELAGKLGVLAVADERLKEIGFGEWEGKTAEEVCAADPVAFKRFYLDPANYQPEGAERLRHFYIRVSEAWEEITQRNEERLLVVAHSGVLRVIVTYVLKAPLLSMYRMQIPSAGMITIKFSDEKPPTIQF